MKFNIDLKKDFVYFIFFIIYFYFICLVTRCLPINSDIANHMLQAQDFLSGNFFMKDWNFSGVTFLTTDLLFYDIAYLFFFIFWKSFYISSALMIFSVVLISFFLTFKNNEKSKLKLFLFFCFCLVFSYFYLLNIRIHSGALFFTFIVFLLFFDVLEKYFKDKKNKIILILFVLSIFLGAFGDFLFIIECIFPIVIYLIFSILQENNNGNISDKMKIFLYVVINLIFVFVADKIYFLISKANKHSYINNQCFVEPNRIYESFLVFINNLLNLSSGNYWDYNIGKFITYTKLANFIIVLFGIVLVFYIIFSFFSLKKVDNISILLSFSVVFVFLANIFTPFNLARYTIIIPFALYILIIRNLDYISNIFRKKNFFVIIFCILSMFCFIGKVTGINCAKLDAKTEEMKEVVTFLKEKNLSHGFSSFWQSSVFTVLSEGKVKIRHIDFEKNIFYKSNWFCKNNWYNEDTNFILFDLNRDESFILSFGQDEAKKNFGLPDKIFSYKSYVIFVYSKNLSTLIQKRLN